MICTHKTQSNKKIRLMIINDHIYVKLRLQEKYKRYKIVYHNSQLNPKREKIYRNKNPLNNRVSLKLKDAESLKWLIMNALFLISRRCILVQRFITLVRQEIYLLFWQYVLSLWIKIIEILYFNHRYTSMARPIKLTKGPDPLGGGKKENALSKIEISDPNEIMLPFFSCFLIIQ